MLLGNEYNIYVNGIISLVRTVVIKSVQTINAINNNLSFLSDTLSMNESDWKYYRNIAGLPYIGSSGNNDDPNITILSLDTNLVIPFTPTSLASNPVTLIDYLTYGISYNNLLIKYPNHESLIRGVLAPINITDAINADDYQIIGYDKTQLGQGETNLISDLQQWVNNFTSRWDMPSYAFTDPLYTAAFLSTLYSNLVLEVIVRRLKNCKTNQVHEFHLWSYLGGYFGLDQYKGIIPFQQALFLYRNLDNIVANAGKKATFDYLNTNFALPFNLQLSAFDIRKELGSALDNLNNGDLQNLQNTIVVSMYNYGDSNEITTTSKLLDVPTLVNTMLPLATLNPNNVTSDVSSLQTAVLSTRNMEMPTGLIEGSVIQSVVVNMVNTISEKYHNWFYLVANNFIKYKIIINITNENVSNITISPNDAAALLIYASDLYYNQLHFQSNVDTIPTIQVRDIMVNPYTLPTPLTEAQVIGVIEPRYLSGTISNVITTRSWNRLTDILSTQVYPTEILNIGEFSTYIDKVVNAKILQVIIPDLEPSALGRSEVQFLEGMFLQNITCTLIPETSYAAFFARIGFNPSTFSSASLENLITTIMSSYLGITADNNVLQSPYSEMVDILQTISSYTLQFVKSAPSDNVTPLDLSDSRPSVNGLETTNELEVISHGIDNITYVSSVQHITYNLSVESDVDIKVSTGYIEDTALIEPGPDLNTTLIYSELFNLNNAGSNFTLAI